MHAFLAPQHSFMHVFCAISPFGLDLKYNEPKIFTLILQKVDLQLTQKLSSNLVITEDQSTPSKTIEISALDN